MKTTTRLLALPVLGLLGATLAFTEATALSSTVGPSGPPIYNYATIQAAINAASAGDTINVAAGTYPELLTISKALTISGADGAVLDGTTLGLEIVGVKIKSGNVTFDNIDLQHFSGNGIIVGYEAATPGSLKNVHITNCKISGIQPGYSHGFGIYVGYESEAFKYVPPRLTAHLDYSGLLIENNEITDSRSSALVLQSITGTPGTLMVRNNFIHDGDNDGVWIDCARNIIIEDNVVQNNMDGFYISSYGDAFLYKWVYDWSNQQLNGPYGPMNISITGNTIVDNNTSGGVYLAAGYPATIAINGNAITGNVPGVANYLSEQVNATCNWWGAANGPGPVGPGSGDTVSLNVDYSPWLLAPGGLCSGAVVTSKNQCMKGGWQTLFRADGTPFKNQGDCIQYVNTGK